ncbi:MAG: DUF4276 family protein [Nitrospira sp.]|nr:DUF4276 family protein [Nitrospira sp.]
MSNSVVVSAAVEGDVDEAVVRKLIEHVGAIPGTVYGKLGKASLRAKIAGYNNAARHAPWIVLVDLDHDYECAPPFLNTWLPNPSPFLCFRVAVREVEAWLLADARHLADFLRVPRSTVPAHPEELTNPKVALVNLARSSRNKAIQENMVPRQESGRQVGPAYSSRLIEFIRSSWQPNLATQRSESLRRALICLRRLTEGKVT